MAAFVINRDGILPARTAVAAVGRRHRPLQAVLHRASVTQID